MRLTLNPTVAELIREGIVTAWPLDQPLDLTCEFCKGQGRNVACPGPKDGCWGMHMGHDVCLRCNGSGTIDRIEVWANGDTPIDCGEWRVSYRLVDGTASPYAVGPNSKIIDLHPDSLRCTVKVAE